MRLPSFTQRDFFSDNEIGLLVSAISAAGTIREESSYEPWANVFPEAYEVSVLDLMRAYDAVVVS